MAIIASITGLVLLIDFAAATTTFKPECSLPPPGTNYVAGPNTRSTLSILWNCLSIIFLCTWSIQHLNVPAMRREPWGFWQKQWWKVLDSMTKVKWMILTILIPEYLVGRALGEWLAALKMVELGWTMTDAYMANMGYFVLDVSDYYGTATEKEQGGKQVDTADAERRIEVDVNTVELGYGLRSSETLPEAGQINLNRMSGHLWALNARQWDRAASDGIGDPRGVPASRLEKLDKGGALVKALALIQVTYLVVQLIARKVTGLPSSQLEIAALAFAASSAVTYVLFWSRPQGVETISIIKATGKPSESFRIAAARLGPRYLWLGRRRSPVVEPDQGPIPIPNDASHMTSDFSGSDTISRLLGRNDEAASLAAGSLVGGVLFGGLHCLAWNFEFPTPAERTIWRVCAVLTTALPVIAVVPLIIWVRLHPWAGKPKHPRTRAVLDTFILAGLLLPYVVARLVLTVEMFRTLCYLPPEAYKETWSGSFPNWG